MKHLFIINPAAGKYDKTGEFTQRIREACGKRCLAYEILVSRAPGDCEKIAQAAAATGDPIRIYACGGDGTLNEIVNGIAGHKNAAVTHFPGGSGNDFIKIFSEPDAFKDLNRLLDCEVATFDLIRCQKEHYALNICSVGFDARIGTAVGRYKRLPLVSGSGAYILSTGINLVKGIYRHYLIDIDGMDLSVKDGGLPPDSVVQSVDEIMKDSARLIEQYHDPSFGSMHQIVLAPCSPFSVSSELLRQSAIVARQYGVRLHTHLCETKDEENFMLSRYNMRPLEYMASLGWIGDDVWYAHGIHFTTEELDILAQTGTGVAHCPVSNMKLSSGIARIPEMLERGVKVGLAVDGSASQDGSDLLEEIRICFLLHRLNSSEKAPSGYDVLKMATRGSASLLGRTDIGSIEVGKCADFFMVDSRRLELVGATYDPKNVFGTVGLRSAVDYTVVNGKVTVDNGQLVNIDEPVIAEEARKVCDEYLAK